jgi:6-phosphogluconolactonase/glucosamine-6-phosphate isomerase/deaminase
MDIKVCKDETQWVEAINTWLNRKLIQFKSRRVFLPAGDTPLPLYKNWSKVNPSFLKGLRFVQLDEILSGPQERAFQKFFRSALPNFQNQMEYIDSAELGGELAILGLGTNGHVAFHEPGLSSRFYSGCVMLQPETVKRIGAQLGDKVVTYGLDAFLRSKAILLIVRGESKAAVLKKILLADCSLPAAQLKSHPDFTIITDIQLE